VIDKLEDNTDKQNFARREMTNVKVIDNDKNDFKINYRML
jgi:hypothetical protein